MNVNAFILGLVVGIFPRNLARFISHAMIFLYNPQMVLEDWPMVVVCIFPLPVQVSSIYRLKMAVTEKEAKERNFRRSTHLLQFPFTNSLQGTSGQGTTLKHNSDSKFTFGVWV